MEEQSFGWSNMWEDLTETDKHGKSRRVKLNDDIENIPFTNMIDIMKDIQSRFGSTYDEFRFSYRAVRDWDGEHFDEIIVQGKQKTH